MGLLTCCLVVLVSYCSLKVVLVAAGVAPEINNCSIPRSIQLITRQEINKTVIGRVQICENKIWKDLCDNKWTLSDAKVACRSLEYSSSGAKNITQQVVVGGSPSTEEVHCSGSEKNISECTFSANLITGNCGFTVVLQCYKSNNDTSSLTTNQASASFATTSVTTSLPSTRTTLSPLSTTSGNATTSTTQSGSGNKNSSSLFKPPNLYYFIVGVAAVVMAVVLLVLVMVMFCFCGRTQSKGISPYNVEKQDGFTKEDGGTQCLDVLDGESTKIKDEDDLMHHQLQQSGPIYEAIQSNENSSPPHSQESPSTRSATVDTNGPSLQSPHRHQGTELYSVLQSTDTYSELEAHIPSSIPTRTELPNFDSDYQQLDHKTASLKRNRAPTIHAVNRTALTQGLLKEEFLQQDNRTPRYASFSLPRDGHLSSHRPPLLHNRSLERPTLELQPRCDDHCSNDVDHNQEKENFYQTIESPPDYASLKELDEDSVLSTNGMDQNDIASNRYENIVCSSHLPTCHSPECPGNSGPVPSQHTSSHSSPTCSHSSSSAQISRASDGSSLVSKDHVKPITHKHTENSELPGENMGSDHLEGVSYSGITKPNRLPGDLDNTGGQSDHIDRYTLV